jgi:hypothetical protein
VNGGKGILISEEESKQQPAAAGIGDILLVFTHTLPYILPLEIAENSPFSCSQLYLGPDGLPCSPVCFWK